MRPAFSYSPNISNRRSKRMILPTLALLLLAQAAAAQAQAVWTERFRKEAGALAAEINGIVQATVPGILGAPGIFGGIRDHF